MAQSNKDSKAVIQFLTNGVGAGYAYTAGEYAEFTKEKILQMFQGHPGMIRPVTEDESEAFYAKEKKEVANSAQEKEKDEKLARLEEENKKLLTEIETLRSAQKPKSGQ